MLYVTGILHNALYMFFWLSHFGGRGCRERACTWKDGWSYSVAKWKFALYLAIQTFAAFTSCHNTVILRWQHKLAWVSCFLTHIQLLFYKLRADFTICLCIVNNVQSSTMLALFSTQRIQYYYISESFECLF